MKKQWKRLLIAALSSSSVFAATWYWYQSSVIVTNRDHNEKPLAYVGKAVDDIQRRQASRLLWQSVDTGEPLYNGEAIRTGARGEVRIQFSDSERYLDLEPESLIVIKKSEGEIALDLMEGSLFVNAQNAQGEGGTGLVLNSANGKVDLSKASASLSKGSGSNIDVQVLEGTASIQGADGQSQNLNSASQIEVLSPLPQKPIALNAESPQPVSFVWKGFPPGTQVSLWVGPTRRQLKEIAKTPVDQTQVQAPLSFGRHFWQLIGKDATGKVIESPVYRSEVIPRFAPTVVFPTADAEIEMEKAKQSVDFRWQIGDDMKQTTLEIWSDESLRHKVFSRSFGKEEAFAVPDLKKGTYYWRLSSYYVDTEAPLLGKIQKFSLKSQEEIAAGKYVPVDLSVALEPAQYTQYYIDKPKLDLKWKIDKGQKVANWNIKLIEESSDPAKAKAVQVQGSSLEFSTPMPKPGRYLASIEALDPKGQVLGNILSQPVSIMPLPLLKAPVISPAEGVLQSGLDGRTQLKWTALEGAAEYVLTIRRDGKELKKLQYKNNSASLRNLLPGEYELELTAKDAHGRWSEKGSVRTLLVPDKSGVKAPTLKKIKVN